MTSHSRKPSTMRDFNIEVRVTDLPPGILGRTDRHDLSVQLSAAADSRTLAHELFHCAFAVLYGAERPGEEVFIRHLVDHHHHPSARSSADMNRPSFERTAYATSSGSGPATATVALDIAQAAGYRFDRSVSHVPVSIVAALAHTLLVGFAAGLSAAEFKHDMRTSLLRKHFHELTPDARMELLSATAAWRYRLATVPAAAEVYTGLTFLMEMLSP